jgi:hypothetical protein
MNGLFPEFSAYGILEYLLFGSGIALGMALFSEPMSKVEGLIAGLKS